MVKLEHADIMQFYTQLVKNIKISNYLEIGVRRGRSMSVLASQANDADFYGFDLWVKNYTGSENPGAEFVRRN